jgi:hypothetical protein
VKLKNSTTDVITSGGQYIPPIEVEDMLGRYLAAAMVDATHFQGLQRSHRPAATRPAPLFTPRDRRQYPSEHMYPP